MADDRQLIVYDPQQAAFMEALRRWAAQVPLMAVAMLVSVVRDVWDVASATPGSVWRGVSGWFGAAPAAVDTSEVGTPLEVIASQAEGNELIIDEGELREVPVPSDFSGDERQELERQAGGHIEEDRDGMLRLVFTPNALVGSDPDQSAISSSVPAGWRPGERSWQDRVDGERGPQAQSFITDFLKEERRLAEQQREASTPGTFANAEAQRQRILRGYPTGTGHFSL